MVTVFGKRSFFLLMLTFSSAFSFANMANPIVNGSEHSLLFTTTDGHVKREFIDIDIFETDRVLYAKCMVTYEILSDKRQRMPLLFLGLDLFGQPSAKVNGKTVPIVMDSTRPEGTFLFDANVNQGDNRIVVIYQAKIEYDNHGLEREYTLRYALYPAKYWKSFGPIQIRLHKGNVEIRSSNLQNLEETDSVYLWNTDAYDMEYLEIVFVGRQSVLAKILLFLKPGGIASIAFILLGFWNVNLLKRHRRKSRLILWLGVLIVPTVFFFVYLESYRWIDAALHQDQNHGYNFFIVVIWPLLAILYATYLFWKLRKP